MFLDYKLENMYLSLITVSDFKEFFAELYKHRIRSRDSSSKVTSNWHSVTLTYFHGQQ